MHLRDCHVSVGNNTMELLMIPVISHELVERLSHREAYFLCSAMGEKRSFTKETALCQPSALQDVKLHEYSSAKGWSTQSDPPS